MKKLILLIMLLVLSFSNAYANNCPDKDISGRLSIHGTDYRYYEEHNMSFISIRDKHGRKVSFQVSYGDRKKYLNHKGSSATITYKTVQFYNEHDGECQREDQVLSIK